MVVMCGSGIAILRAVVVVRECMLLWKRQVLPQLHFPTGSRAQSAL